MNMTFLIHDIIKKKVEKKCDKYPNDLTDEKIVGGHYHNPFLRLDFCPPLRANFIVKIGSMFPFMVHIKHYVLIVRPMKGNRRLRPYLQSANEIYIAH